MHFPKTGSLISDLESLGLDPTLPTLFIWEAVLFYVNESPKRRIFTELYTFNKSPERNENSAVVFTDSLKPFLDVPFTSETDRFFDGLQADLGERFLPFIVFFKYILTIINNT